MIILFLVVDFCLMKQLKNEMKSNYSMLVMNWASKSNCIQRSGRVGRVAEGRVYRLVPENIFMVFIRHYTFLFLIIIFIFINCPF